MQMSIRLPRGHRHRRLTRLNDPPLHHPHGTFILFRTLADHQRPRILMLDAVTLPRISVQQGHRDGPAAVSERVAGPLVAPAVVRLLRERDKIRASTVAVFHGVAARPPEVGGCGDAATCFSGGGGGVSFGGGIRREGFGGGGDHVVA